jgi:hypothetical protein
MLFVFKSLAPPKRKAKRHEAETRFVSQRDDAGKKNQQLQGGYAALTP